jgi:hypothetical protein
MGADSSSGELRITVTDTSTGPHRSSPLQDALDSHMHPFGSRSGLTPPDHALRQGRESASAEDDLSDLPAVAGSSREYHALTLTPEQVAHHILVHATEPNSHLALPHLVRVLQQNGQATRKLSDFIQDHGGALALSPSPAGTRGFAEDFSSNIGSAKELVQPTIDALIKASAGEQAAHEQNAQLTTANTQLTAQQERIKKIALYKQAAWTFVGSLVTGGVAVGLTFLGDYITSLHPVAGSVVQCVCNITGA